MASGLEIFQAESKLEVLEAFDHESIIAKSQAGAIVPQTQAPTAPTATSWLRGLSQYLPKKGDGSAKKLQEDDEATPKLAASSSSEASDGFDKAAPLNEIAQSKLDSCPQCVPKTCASDSTWMESLNAKCNTDVACANVSNVEILAFMKKEEPAVSAKREPDEHSTLENGSDKPSTLENGSDEPSTLENGGDLGEPEEPWGKQSWNYVHTKSQGLAKSLGFERDSQRLITDFFKPVETSALKKVSNLLSSSARAFAKVSQATGLASSQPKEKAMKQTTIPHCFAIAKRDSWISAAKLKEEDRMASSSTANTENNRTADSESMGYEADNEDPKKEPKAKGMKEIVVDATAVVTASITHAVTSTIDVLSSLFHKQAKGDDVEDMPALGATIFPKRKQSHLPWR